jgi:hypothetical protein
LYGIVDLGYVAVADLKTVTARLLQGGIDVLQLRAKEHAKLEIMRCADTILPLTKELEIPLIMNDYKDLLRAVNDAVVTVSLVNLPIRPNRRSPRNERERTTSGLAPCFRPEPSLQRRRLDSPGSEPFKSWSNYLYLLLAASN